MRLRFDLSIFPALKQLELTQLHTLKIHSDGSDDALKGIEERRTHDEGLKKKAKREYGKLAKFALTMDFVSDWVWRAFKDPGRKFSMIDHVRAFVDDDRRQTERIGTWTAPRLYIRYDMDSLQTLGRRTEGFDEPVIAFGQHNVGQEEVTAQ